MLPHIPWYDVFYGLYHTKGSYYIKYWSVWHTENSSRLFTATFGTLKRSHRLRVERIALKLLFGYGNQFPEELREPVTRLTIFCSFSWTLTMIQHLVIPLPERGVCNSSLVRLAAKKSKCFETVWNYLNHSDEPAGNTRKSNSRCWFKTFGFLPVFCLQTVGRN
jgi:hypothetical protein